MDVGWELSRALRSGRPADFADRSIKGASIAAALFAATTVHRRGLTLRRARVTGDIDLSNLHIEAPLVLQGTTFDANVMLGGARVRHLMFLGCDLAGYLQAEGLFAHNDVTISKTTVHGPIAMPGSQIGGNLIVQDGSRVGEDRDGDSLWLDGSVITGNLVIRGPRSGLSGAVRMYGVRCGGTVNLGVDLTVGRNSARESLQADRAEIRNSLQLSELRATGCVRLIGASIGGQLTVTGRTELGPDADGDALVLSSGTFKGDIIIGRQLATLGGCVRAGNTTVEGRLRLGPVAKLDRARDGLSLDVRAADLRTVVVDGNRLELAGGIDLGDAKVRSSVTIAGGARVGVDEEGWSLILDEGDLSSTVTIQGLTTELAGGVRMVGSRISGQVEVRGGATVGARPPGQSFFGDGASVGGNFLLSGRGVSLAGAVRLNGATIGGQLSIVAGAVVGHSDTGRSVDADGLRVGSDLVIAGRRTVLTGGVRLVGGRVKGQLLVRDHATIGATVHGRSMDGDGIVVDGAAHFVTPTLKGAIVLHAGKINVQLMIGPDCLVGADPTGTSVGLERATIDGSLIVAGPSTVLQGALHLAGTTVQDDLILSETSVGESRSTRYSIFAPQLTTRELALRDVRLSSGAFLDGSTIASDLVIGSTNRLNLNRMRIMLSLRNTAIARASLTGHGPDVGLIDLTDAKVGHLADDPSFWGATDARTWSLNGLRADRVAASPEFPSATRTSWLSSSRTRETGRTAPADRATFRNIAAAQAAAGRDGDAVTTLIEMRRRHDPLSLRAALAPIRYGYRPMAALAYMLLIFTTILGLVSVAHSTGDMVATGGLSPAETVDEERDLIASKDCDDSEYPCLRPAVFALDFMIPGLDLGEDERWSIRTGTGTFELNSVLRLLLAVMRVAGWLMLGLLVVGGVNLVFEQERRR